MVAPIPFFRLSNVDLTHLFIAFGAVAIWSTLSLTIRLLTTMKKWSGIYFCSILATTWGLSIRQMGNFVQFYAPSCPWQVGFVLQEIGWVGMISGFSMVLYSRLMIILESQRARRAVLLMIICNCLIWHSAMIIILSGMRMMQYALRENAARAWSHVHDRVENIQVVMFSVQDILISCLYVRAAYRYLQGRFTQRSKTRNAMCLLLLVQLLAIAFDTAIVFMDFGGYLQLTLICFSFVYAIKLELEFVALNQLVEASKMGVPGITSMSLAVDDALKVEKDRAAHNNPIAAAHSNPRARERSFEMSLELESCTSRSSQEQGPR